MWQLVVQANELKNDPTGFSTRRVEGGGGGGGEGGRGEGGGEGGGGGGGAGEEGGGGRVPYLYIGCTAGYAIVSLFHC